MATHAHGRPGHVNPFYFQQIVDSSQAKMSVSNVHSVRRTGPTGVCVSLIKCMDGISDHVNLVLFSPISKIEFFPDSGCWPLVWEKGRIGFCQFCLLLDTFGWDKAPRTNTPRVPTAKLDCKFCAHSRISPVSCKMWWFCTWKSKCGHIGKVQHPRPKPSLLGKRMAWSSHAVQS